MKSSVILGLTAHISHVYFKNSVIVVDLPSIEKVAFISSCQRYQRDNL